MPTEKGLAIIDSFKAKHIPNGYRQHKQGGQDYRFSRRGQVEIKRAMQARAQRVAEALK